MMEESERLKVVEEMNIGKVKVGRWMRKLV